MLVRFLSRGFHNGSIVEPGDVITVDDNTRLGQHMVRLDGDNDHIVDAQPFAGAFRADLAYSPDPAELRAQLTEEAIRRAEATRAREAAEEAARVAASTEPQPSVDQPKGAAGG
ncbi:MAG TPA: hypothetical protein VNU19_24225 [Candidatus Acidoferrum sp.]|jgi:hypothetical protein|nr:hypothetical protein [Candidatus Acidoferrum sp.]